MKLFAMFLCVASLACATVPKIAPAEAAKLVDAGKAILVDVREPSEWEATGVAAPARLLPKSDFDGDQSQWKPFLAETGAKQIIVYCRTGHRSEMVGAALANKGYKVLNAGAFKEWKDAGLPVRPVVNSATVKPQTTSGR
jgi:rhodanese-related sulfurtransferase